MSIQIHGKEYKTVAERVQEAGKDFLSLETEIIGHNPVIIKATVLTIKGKFTGISAANPSKAIEKMSPYEVAETSAVGRALGFAGYGSVDSIASADEMNKVTHYEKLPDDMNKVKSGPITIGPLVQKAIGQPCPDCGEGTVVISPKTQKLFCDKKCWLDKSLGIKPTTVEAPEIKDSDIPF